MNVKNQTFNVGSGKSKSINQITKLFGGKAVNIPKRPGEPDITQTDIKKVRKILNWEPKMKFNAGVKEMIKHIDYWKNAPLWTPTRIVDATRDWFKYLSK